MRSEKPDALDCPTDRGSQTINGTAVVGWEEPCWLSDSELLLWHQLNTAHYWGARADANGHALSADQDQAGALPEKWSLLDGIQLQEWQKECVEKWFAAGRRGVVKVVTGAGKTMVALAIVQRLQTGDIPNLRVAVVVPTIVLMGQWYEVILKQGNLPAEAIGRLGGGFNDAFSEGKRILITVLASAAKLLPQQARQLHEDQQLLLVVDECHRAGATKMSEVLAARRTFSLGLSATPERDDAPDLDDEDAAVAVIAADGAFEDTVIGQGLGQIVYEMTFAQAIERGILPRFEVRHYGLPLSLRERATYERYSREIGELRKALQQDNRTARTIGGGALVGWARKLASRPGSELAKTAGQYVELIGKRKQLLYHAQSRGEAVVKLLDSTLAENPNARVILFHESVEEVMRLFQLLRCRDFRVVAENYRLSESLRAMSIDLFRRGLAQVLISARSLIEGFDVPAADVGIVVASSTSVRQRIQTLGRILRKRRVEQDGEKQAVLHVLYVAGTVDEVIYEKTDWARVIGAEHNVYFQYDPEVDAQPRSQPEPPRRPMPDEMQVDWTGLNAGDRYPGRYEGEEFSCDSHGNVRDAEQRLVLNPQGVDKWLRRTKGSVGRFRVTPHRRAVLVLIPEEGAWGVYLAGLLADPFRFEGEKKEELASVDVKELAPGDEYPGEIRDAVEYRIKRRAGMPAVFKKIGRSEVYARIGKQAIDPLKGEDAERVACAAQQAAARHGQWVAKFLVNRHNHAFYLANGQARFLVDLSAGFEFPQNN